MHHCWQKQYHLETLGSGIPLLMLLSSAFTFFFGPKKAQFIMNAASRNRYLEISGAKTLTEWLLLLFLLLHYGNTGYGVYKGGIQNWKCFWLKINCSQMKLPNFDNWIMASCQKLSSILEKR